MECEITNMVMVENLSEGTVLAENRVKYWKGISFPGGHVEKGESFTDSAVREVMEETGLIIKSPKLCGTVHWCNRDTDNRYIVLLYKATEYDGALIDGTDEGKVFWVKKDKIRDMKLSPHFDTYLNVFFNDNLNEAFGIHDDKQSDPMIIL